jgi:ABC-type transport system substrate-binding protein
LVPPGIPGFDQSFRNPYRSGDLALARRLLLEAGYPNGVDPKTGEPLALAYDNAATTAVGRQVVALLQRQVARIGVRLESRTFRSNVLQQRILDGKFQLAWHLWIADYPDAENFLFLVYGPNRRPGPNRCAYRNDEVDRLFEQLRSMPDGAERARLIERMRSLVVEDCPIVPLYHGAALVLRHAWLRNSASMGLDVDTSKYLGVDSKLRSELRAKWNRPILWPIGLALAVGAVALMPARSALRRRAQRRARSPLEAA